MLGSIDRLKDKTTCIKVRKIIIDYKAQSDRTAAVYSFQRRVGKKKRINSPF